MKLSNQEFAIIAIALIEKRKRLLRTDFSEYYVECIQEINELLMKLNQSDSLLVNDQMIVEDILIEALIKLKKLDIENLPKIHYQINVSYES